VTFLADENIPYAVIKRLRGEGVEIISVLEEFRGINDEKIRDLIRAAVDYHHVR